MVRYECKRMIQIAMIPSATVPADFWSFLEPTIKSLEILQADGMVIKKPTKTMRAKVHVLMATGDIPALAKLACHAGHTSKNGCRICNVVGQTPGHGQYFRTLPGTTIRTVESFRSFNPDSVLCKGLKGQSPFASLTSFTGPFFFALDEMHGLCHGIGKQVWGLVCGKYGSKHPLFLSAGAQKEIGAAMEGTRGSIPTSFHGAWRDVARHAGYFRAVDWADFLLFVVPTLVAERVHDQDARKALLGLVQACTLLMSWELSVEEQTSIKRNLIKRNSCLEGHFQNGKVGIEIFTINQHLLQNYPAMMGAFGTPRAYSARSLERAIGEYSRSIKSNSAIGANAGNIMLRLARTRRVDVNGASVVKARTTARILQYDDKSAGWPMTEEGEHVGVDSDIEFWGPLGCRTIHDSIEEISCLPVLLAKFYESKGVECSTIDPALTTSRKAFVNGCVIDSAFAHKVQREAHHVRLQLQVNKATNARPGSSPALKDFFVKVVLFFEHVNEGKRWPLALVLVYSTMLYNGVPVARNGQMKPKVVHLADVKELVGLVVSGATVNTTTATTTAYIVWPELNRGPKLSLGSFADTRDLHAFWKSANYCFIRETFKIFQI
ncbi:hypothetical protein PHYBLDRAFT_150202 [Phycomyces blakesleeanus NRRL 1555(-)]|uniref:Uncharacterized protein n=1 Tax=Phycomyces blakesleeanus (strain ATCC 8743b / DSM 1359 / FGSC 10004 / NBRC 33097 / NRRL 1555) TaxID=763407 RepID=A0A162TNR8_PHYB8|nr:hypothetical protein PHYBLDRAFT_150202 [Phycomyces blakesleeanus NRRL 1555(-)]OAD68603.1 hypothetical protein PHYBLDRAFT_150202 [Phycomyces blakesleeanus NRRL 1555(-)]|eukprot:XP_018286643.1 hypothetical protein PHYBLDRAFT_150202 [Phycomyces blakesleeanus NRRL 1555(-)]